MHDLNNELLLQRLVDGELTDRERAGLLAQIESAESPHGWRKLALSFVENQVLASSFAETDQNSSVRSRRTSRSRWRRWAGSVTSVAAAALIGVFSGIGGHYWLNSGRPELAAVPRGSSEMSLASTSGNPDSALPGAQAPISVMNPSLTSLGGGPREPLPVPAPNLSSDELQLWPQLRSFTLLPDDEREKLEAEGFAVEGVGRWYRAPLSDGHQIAVPVEELRIRRVQR